MADDDIERLLKEVAAGTSPSTPGRTPAQLNSGAEVVPTATPGGLGTTGRVLVSGGAGAAVSLITYAIPVVGWMDSTQNLLAGFLGGVTGFAVASIFRRRDRNS